MSSIYTLRSKFQWCLSRPFCQSRIDPRRKVSKGTSGIWNTKTWCSSHDVSWSTSCRNDCQTDRYYHVQKHVHKVLPGEAHLFWSRMRNSMRDLDWVSTNVWLPHCRIQGKLNNFLLSQELTVRLAEAKCRDLETIDCVYNLRKCRWLGDSVSSEWGCPYT